MAASVLLAILTTLAALSAAAAHPAPSPIRGAYYPSWFQSTFPPSSIKTHLFTHIYYAFLAPNSTTFEFNVDPQTQAPLLLNFTSTLRRSKSPVKTLFSVGGAAEGAALFSRMASTPSSRAAFIRSSIKLARTFHFDGIDLDWEFPQNPTDMQNLGYLLEEWRAEVNREAAAGGRRRLLLTAAVYYSADTFLSGTPRAYPIASISKNLELINVMNYDYRGGWDTTATGAHAALFDPTGNLSTSFGLGTWIRAGVPLSKIVMGLPLYGRTWTLKDPNVHGVGAPAVAVGPGDSGVLLYSEVVKFNRDNKAKVVYDAATGSTYSVAGTAWIGYDDVTSVTVKIGYARRQRLGGYFFWALSYDYQWTISERAKLAWRH